jgi:hypothetical protein
MRAAMLLAAGLLAGCTLIDQRTFETHRSTPAQASLAARVATRPIAISDGAPGWPARLAATARDAATRDPGRHFDLVAPVPLTGTEAARAAFRARQQANLEQAATALAAAGIDPVRIRIGYRGDPGSPAPQVELFAR